ncbi:hypothetical protein DW084_09610 [Enterococcus casseliflavus]|uniref:Uncharacterized protein n=1 Tax=Enterococcus casseliflavus TaxID=37734 RepID=A0A415ESC1_ENTCA|nr:hypothetical protein DW084_09610 [Enterococcus casseliflavus]
MILPWLRLEAAATGDLPIFSLVCNDRLAVSQSVFLHSSKKWYTVTETAAQRRQHISSCAAKNGFHEVKT